MIGPDLGVRPDAFTRFCHRSLAVVRRGTRRLHKLIKVLGVTTKRLGGLLQLLQVTGPAVVSKTTFRKDELLKRARQRRDVAFDVACSCSRGRIVAGQNLLHDRKEAEGVGLHEVDRRSNSGQLLFAVFARGNVFAGRRAAAGARADEVWLTVAALTHFWQALERSAQCSYVIEDVKPSSEQPVISHVFIRKSDWCHDTPPIADVHPAFSSIIKKLN